MITSIKSSLNTVKENKPLILCLTNYVTMDFMANSLLALGAAPLMSEASEELEELVTISQAVYINLGTLNTAFMQRAIQAAQYARALNKPIILDPVGAGASLLRTKAALELMPFAQVIRGNASEILALSGAVGSSKGVETSHSVTDATSVAQALAQKLNTVIVVSGPEDFITNGKDAQTLAFGSNLMPLVTGMGCTMTAVLSAFVANNRDHYQAATHASAFFSLCGQNAELKTKTPGSFRQVFIDSLYAPNWDYFQEVAS